MTIYRLGELTPDIPASCHVAAEATLIGRVTLGERTSVWPGAVLRADNEPIRVGDDCNVQEGAVLHTDPGFPLDLGKGVSVGHQAMLHGCSIGEGTLVGIQAVVMNGAVIGRQCLIAAGALVTEGKQFPDRSLILGAPAKAVRTLGDEELARLAGNADGYVRRGARYKAELQAIG
ncbi:gamma carbonic anhydrase family protein [Piscinibacter sakaiensis]|uniref:gamma carbonic anhydrase family protein n=1 Tax=Piscinibacter sakaiensis TaxID=1547922 RepID=UPI003AADEB62